MLPDLREINFTYDANGNVASITPPGRPLHGFDYNAVDLENQYAPPNVTPPLTDPRTFFTYNLDQQLTSITRPDGQVISMGYDPGGRLSAVTNPNSEAYQMVYTPAGLMTAFTNPRSLTASVTYDALGLLDKDLNPANGFLQTARTEDADGYTVSATMAEGRTSTEIVGYR